MPHCILFEFANFRGAHRHVFTAESDLAASDDATFNKKTSSIVVLEGYWVFFADPDFKTYIVNHISPGLYPFVVNIGIPNDAITSLRPLR
jgi:hypothetical protein